MYLCGRKADHSRQQYFLVPELISEGPYTAEVNAVRRRLTALPAHCFERIVQDIYDEVNTLVYVKYLNLSLFILFRFLWL